MGIIQRTSWARQILEDRKKYLIRVIAQQQEELEQLKFDLEEIVYVLNAIGQQNLFSATGSKKVDKVNSLSQAVREYMQNADRKLKVSEIAHDLLNNGFRTGLSTSKFQIYVARTLRRLKKQGKVRRERTPNPDGNTERERKEGIFRYWWLGTDLYGIDKDTS